MTDCLVGREGSLASGEAAGVAPGGRRPGCKGMEAPLEHAAWPLGPVPPGPPGPWAKHCTPWPSGRGCSWDQLPCGARALKTRKGQHKSAPGSLAGNSVWCLSLHAALPKSKGVGNKLVQPPRRPERGWGETRAQRPGHPTREQSRISHGREGSPRPVRETTRREALATFSPWVLGCLSRHECGGEAHSGPRRHAHRGPRGGSEPLGPETPLSGGRCAVTLPETPWAGTWLRTRKSPRTPADRGTPRTACSLGWAARGQGHSILRKTTKDTQLFPE